MVKLVWRLSGAFMDKNMVNCINKQSPYYFYHKISIKSITLHTVFIEKTIMLKMADRERSDFYVVFTMSLFAL